MSEQCEDVENKITMDGEKDVKIKMLKEDIIVLERRIAEMELFIKLFQQEVLDEVIKYANRNLTGLRRRRKC